MDKSILRDYISILSEKEEEDKRIEALESEIASMKPEQKEVSDIITKGKRGRKSLGMYKIHGYEDHKTLNKKE